MFAGQGLSRDARHVVLERDWRCADILALVEVDLRPGTALVRQTIDVVVRGRRVGVGNNLLVLELPEEVREDPKRQAQLLRDSSPRRGADVQEQPEDEGFELSGVQAGLGQARHW